MLSAYTPAGSVVVHAAPLLGVHPQDLFIHRQLTRFGGLVIGGRDIRNCFGFRLLSVHGGRMRGHGLFLDARAAGRPVAYLDVDIPEGYRPYCIGDRIDAATSGIVTVLDGDTLILWLDDARPSRSPTPTVSAESEPPMTTLTLQNLAPIHRRPVGRAALDGSLSLILAQEIFREVANVMQQGILSVSTQPLVCVLWSGLCQHLLDHFLCRHQLANAKLTAPVPRPMPFADSWLACGPTLLEAATCHANLEPVLAVLDALCAASNIVPDTIPITDGPVSRVHDAAFEHDGLAAGMHCWQGLLLDFQHVLTVLRHG